MEITADSAVLIQLTLLDPGHVKLMGGNLK